MCKGVQGGVCGRGRRGADAQQERCGCECARVHKEASGQLREGAALGLAGTRPAELRTQGGLLPRRLAGFHPGPVGTSCPPSTPTACTTATPLRQPLGPPWPFWFK